MKHFGLIIPGFLILTVLLVGTGNVFAQQGAMDGEGEIAFEEGIAAFEEGNWGAALSKFSEALKIEPNNAQARHYRGVTLLKLDQPQEAVKELEKAKSIDPKARDLNLDLGAAYQELGKLDEAEAAYREETKNHPDNAQAHFSLGYLLFKRGKYGDSMPEFAKAGQLDPELEMAASFYQASALYKMGKRSDAQSMFESLLEKEPPPEIAQASRKYLDSLKQKTTPRKNWGVVGSALYQYDSNVVAASEDAEFPIFIEDEEISDEEDYRGVVTLSGFYRYVKANPWVFEGRYAFYQSFHADIDMFNLQYHAPAVTVARLQKFGNYDTMIAVDYRFGESLLGTDYEWYNLNHWGTVSFRINWTNKIASTIGYAYNFEDFNSNQPDRDNAAHSGFTKFDWIFLNDRASITAIAGMDFEDADDVAYDVRRPWVKFAMAGKLPLDMRARLSLAYEHEDHYDDDLQEREDDVYGVEFLLFRPVWGPVEANLGVSYKKNESSVDSLTYERTIVGGGLVVRY